jgi:hypothetical protein
MYLAVPRTIPGSLSERATLTTFASDLSGISGTELGDSEIEDLDDPIRFRTITFSGLISRCTMPRHGLQPERWQFVLRCRCGVQFKPAAAHFLAKSDALNKLGDDEMQTIGLTEFVDGKDIGMIQR